MAGWAIIRASWPPPMTASVGARCEPVEDTTGAYATGPAVVAAVPSSVPPVLAGHCVGGRLEAEPAAAVGGDERGLARVVPELAAQPPQVHVDGLRVGVERRLPHVGHQLAAGDDVARARHEGVQELELL